MGGATTGGDVGAMDTAASRGGRGGNVSTLFLGGPRAAAAVEELLAPSDPAKKAIEFGIVAHRAMMLE